MPLSDLICCPVCRGELDTANGQAPSVVCRGCQRRYPIRDGVPILLRDPAASLSEHQHALSMRPHYSPWKDRVVLKSLTDAQIALDFGAGRQVFDDPCIIKLDIVFDPTLDLVGDLHEIPLKDNSVDYAFGGAVMEHIRDPARAIDELYRVIKPGGYVYADWSFMTAYHGYPNHFTNVTVNGIRDAFRQFSAIEIGVGPHLGPAFAVRSLLATFLEHFKPATRTDREFVQLLYRVLWHPLDELQERIPKEDWFRTAAGVYFFGIKEVNTGDTILPAPVVDLYKRRPDLQQRFPSLTNLSAPDNIMAWAMSEGLREPALAEYFRSLDPFSKTGQPDTHRPAHDFSWDLIDRPGSYPGTEQLERAFWHARPFGARLLDAWDERGAAGVYDCFARVVRRYAQGSARMVGRQLAGRRKR